MNDKDKRVEELEESLAACKSMAKGLVQKNVALQARIAELEERYERLQFFWSWGGAEKAHERVWQIEQELEVARYQGLHYPNEDQINDFTEVIHNLRSRLGGGIAYADSLRSRIKYGVEVAERYNSIGSPSSALANVFIKALKPDEDKVKEDAS